MASTARDGQKVMKRPKGTPETSDDHCAQCLRRRSRSWSAAMGAPFWVPLFLMALLFIRRASAGRQRKKKTKPRWPYVINEGPFF